MGRLNPQVTHFSHHHPLDLTNISKPNHSICWGCRISILPGRPYYSCNTCGFCLHGTCFNLPRKISHPAEPNHHLVLVLSPSFHCKACGNPGSGFAFNCKECNHDYHSLCTLKPLSVTNPMHRHPLCLEFKTPYGGQGFRCDLCGNPGLNQWFYSCSECGFDIHLDCPTAEPVENRFDSTTRSVMNPGLVNHVGFYPQPNLNGSLPGANGTPPGYYGQNQAVLLTPSNRVPMTTVLQPNGAMAGPIPTRGGSMNGMGGLITGSIVTGMCQQFGQELVGGLTSGFGGGSGSSGNSGGGFSDIVDCWAGGDFA